LIKRVSLDIISDIEMDRPTQKDEENELNQQELEERIKVNYLKRNNKYIKKIITRCPKDHHCP
jgi:hypothetical protein